MRPPDCLPRCNSRNRRHAECLSDSSSGATTERTAKYASRVTVRSPSGSGQSTRFDLETRLSHTSRLPQVRSNTGPKLLFGVFSSARSTACAPLSIVALIGRGQRESPRSSQSPPRLRSDLSGESGQVCASRRRLDRLEVNDDVTGDSVSDCDVERAVRIEVLNASGQGTRAESTWRGRRTPPRPTGRTPELPAPARPTLLSCDAASDSSYCAYVHV